MDTYDSLEAGKQEFEQHYGEDVDYEHYSNEDEEVEKRFTSFDDLEPLNDLVVASVIEKESEEKTTDSGIIIPDGEEHESVKARVMKVGPEVDRFDEGAVILRRAGRSMVFETEDQGKVILIREGSIMAHLPPEAEE